MKKRLFLVLTVLTFVLTFPTYAVQKRTADVIPGLSFDGTTATCCVSVMGDYATDEIEVDVELWQENTLVKSWSDEGEEAVIIK